MARGIKGYPNPALRYPPPGGMHLVEVDPLPTLGPLSPAQKLRKLGRNLLPPRLRSTNGINENSQIPS